MAKLLDDEPMTMEFSPKKRRMSMRDLAAQDSDPAEVKAVCMYKFKAGAFVMSLTPERRNEYRTLLMSSNRSTEKCAQITMDYIDCWNTLTVPSYPSRLGSDHQLLGAWEHRSMGD
jgi:hypothetical protein